MNKDEQKKQILEVLDLIRPYLVSDGGDVEFVDIDDDGIVKIKMVGACASCTMADVTIYQGIEQSLVEEVPGVIGVEVVDNNDWIL